MTGLRSKARPLLLASKLQAIALLMLCLLGSEAIAGPPTSSSPATDLSAALIVVAEKFGTEKEVCFSSKLLPSSMREKGSLGAEKLAALEQSNGGERKVTDLQPWPVPLFEGALKSAVLRDRVERGRRDYARCPNLILFEAPVGNRNRFIVRAINVIDRGHTRYHAAFLFAKTPDGDLKLIKQTDVSIIVF